MNQDCLVCGAKQPAGHVVVRNLETRDQVGRVCSKHTLWEVIADQGDRLTVEILWDSKEMVNHTPNWLGIIFDSLDRLLHRCRPR